VADLIGARTGVQRAAHVRVHGTFETSPDGDTELDQLRRTRVSGPVVSVASLKSS